jgi:hypothetical protein
VFEITFSDGKHFRGETDSKTMHLLRKYEGCVSEEGESIQHRPTHAEPNNEDRIATRLSYLLLAILLIPLIFMGSKAIPLLMSVARNPQVVIAGKCKQLALKELTSPATATFSKFYISKHPNEDGTHSISFTVDAQNAYGATIRAGGTCRLRGNSIEKAYIDTDLRSITELFIRGQEGVEAP